jgi:hypothetical protein
MRITLVGMNMGPYAVGVFHCAEPTCRKVLNVAFRPDATGITLADAGSLNRFGPARFG